MKTDQKINAPAGGEANGHVYIVGASGSGDFSGFTENRLAAKMTGVWREITPIAGDRIYSTDIGDFIYFNGTSWFQQIGPWVLTYLATHGTTVNSGRSGRATSSSTNYACPFESVLNELWVTFCEVSFKTGAGSGTYSVDALVEDVANSVNFKFFTQTSASTGTYVQGSKGGTLEAPLAVIKHVSTPPRVNVGWFNNASSPDTLEAAAHFCLISGFMMKKVA